jgi:hypothetical protein
VRLIIALALLLPIQSLSKPNKELLSYLGKTCVDASDESIQYTVIRVYRYDHRMLRVRRIFYLGDRQLYKFYFLFPYQLSECF